MYIVEDFNIGASQHPANRSRPRPVIVVAKNPKHRSFDGLQNLAKGVEVGLAVAHKITRNAHKVGLLGVEELDRSHLYAHRRDATDMLVGDVGDAKRGGELLGMFDRPRKSP